MVKKNVLRLSLYSGPDISLCLLNGGSMLTQQRNVIIYIQFFISLYLLKQFIKSNLYYLASHYLNRLTNNLGHVHVR